MKGRLVQGSWGSVCLSWVCLAFGTAADDLTAARRGEARRRGDRLIVPLAFLPSFQEQTACCLGRRRCVCAKRVSRTGVWNDGKAKNDVLIKWKKGNKSSYVTHQLSQSSHFFFKSLPLFWSLESDSQLPDCVSHLLDVAEKQTEEPFLYAMKTL